MRSPSSVSVLSLSLVIASGCSTPSLEGPRTIGDRGRTAWLISDGLCGGGLFGTECALTQALSVGAAPTIVVHERDGVSLAGATLVADGGTLSDFRRELDDGHTHLTADVMGAAAGTVEIRVLDAGGTELDRARVTFVAPARITCGELRAAVVREIDFPGLTSGDVVTPVLGESGTQRTATLACRADDATGAPLLTVDAIRWTVVGSVEGVSVESDVLFPVPPARGATARLVVTTTESGTATVTARLGEITAEIDAAF